MASPFDDCNHTELYQICQKSGLRPPPSYSRDELIGLLFNENTDPVFPVNEIDQWRNALAGFVLAHWSRLQNQVTCPLKSKDPRSCYGCLDTQVIACVTTNANNEDKIREYKK